MAKTRVQKIVVKEFKKTKVIFSEVTFIEGQPQMSESQEIILDGGLTDAECISALAEAGKKNPVVLSTEVLKEKYTMSVEDFIKNATLVVDEKEQVEE